MLFIILEKLKHKLLPFLFTYVSMFGANFKDVFVIVGLFSTLLDIPIRTVIYAINFFFGSRTICFFTSFRLQSFLFFYCKFLIPSSVVTNLMQFQGMGTHPSVFSINKKEICIFEHSSDGRGEIRTWASQTGDRCSTDELFQPLTRSTIFLDYIYVIYAY